MDKERSELRWGVEQRLEFIEFRLFWEGHVNRSDLMEQFGVSVNHARQTPAHVALAEGHGLAAKLLSSLVARSPVAETVTATATSMSVASTHRRKWWSGSA